MKTHWFLASTVVFALVAGSSAAWAHHSFTAFYSRDRNVTVTGVVTKYRFTNPHGIIELDVVDDNGQKHRWTAETSAPTFLRRRRGWDKDSIIVGEVLTISGYGARDGSNLIRLTTVTREDGSVVGKPVQRPPGIPESDEELSD